MKKHCFLLYILIFFALTFFSCKNDDPVKSRQSAVKNLYKHGTVKIAIANSFQVNLSKMWEGVILAQEKIKKDALLPVNLELVKFDDGGDEIKGMTTAYKIASDNEICAVIGHGYSDISLPCSLIYQYHGILTFNFISTVHTLTERNNPLIFSNVPKDSDFGEEVAKVCDKNGYKNVIVYYLENVSGTSVSNAFELNCAKRGISVVSRDSYDITTSEQEIERMTKRWKNNFVFDAIFLVGRMPGISQIISIIRQNGITCPILGPDSFDDPMFTENLDNSENGKIFAVSNYNPESEHPRFQEFYSSFKEKYGTEPDQEAFQAYDALMVLAGGIGKACSANPDEVANVLRQEIWNEAAGGYTFSASGAVQNRKLTAKVFANGKFTKIID